MQTVTQKLSAYLNGHDSSPDQAIYSWASRSIYEIACRIADMGSLTERRVAIESQPETIRERVKSEMTRIWELRRKK